MRLGFVSQFKSQLYRATNIKKIQLNIKKKIRKVSLENVDTFNLTFKDNKMINNFPQIAVFIINRRIKTTNFMNVTNTLNTHTEIRTRT